MSLQPLTPNQREKRTSQYKKWAHWFPLVITMVCAIVIISMAEYVIWNDIALTSQVISCIVGTGFITAFYFLFTRIIRRVSKDLLENRILFKGARKPSTRLLLKEDGTYSLLRSKLVDRADIIEFMPFKPESVDTLEHIKKQLEGKISL